MSAIVTAAAAATGAAFAFAASNALRHRSAADLPAVTPLGVASLARFSLRTVQHPIWLLGMAVDLAGIALHALALHDGPLTLVQPVLVSGLLFAIPFRHWLDRRQPSGAELRWAAVLGAGLVVFLVVATPSRGNPFPPDPLAAWVAAAAMAAALAICLVVWRRAGSQVATFAMGAATGLATSATAALLKSTTGALSQPDATALSAWPLYPLLVVGIGSLLLNQLAFQAGPLRTSLPAITTVDPIASLLIGIGVYDERLRASPPAVGLEVVALAVIVVAAFSLARVAPGGARGRPRPAEPAVGPSGGPGTE